MNKYSFLLLPGLLGRILAYIIFPPLDAGPPLTFDLCLFLLPLALQLLSVVRKRLSEDADRLRKVYILSSLILALFALLLLLNGSLDRSPSISVRTIVMRKEVTRRGSATRYRLTRPLYSSLPIDTTKPKFDLAFKNEYRKMGKFDSDGVRR